jgi:cytochrome c biogenesis protein CcmG/thiol:disulfide interchange protein DsbE
MEPNNDRWVEDRLAVLNPDAEWRPNESKAQARFEERRRSGSRRTWKYAALATAATGICLIAAPAPVAFAGRCLAACTSMIWPPSVSLERGQPLAPDFTLRDVAGRSVRLSDYRGKVVVLNFWATWCPPCRAEIPWFIDFQNRYRDSGLAVIGVSFDQGWDAVRPFVAKTGINYPQVMGTDDVAALYGGVDSLPTTLVIDRTGRVTAVHSGLVDKAKYESEIRAAVGSR